MEEEEKCVECGSDMIHKVPKKQVIRDYNLFIPIKKEMSWLDIVNFGYDHFKNKVERQKWINRARYAYDKKDVSYLASQLEFAQENHVKELLSGHTAVHKNGN